MEVKVAGAVPSGAEPLSGPAPPAGAQCYICMEAAFAGGEAGDSSDGPLAHTGCGCRGGAGFVHVACLLEYAESSEVATNGGSWLDCPTCKQMYTGGLQLCLAQARWGLVRGLPEEDDTRLHAANGLGLALQDSGDDAGALLLLEESLLVYRRQS